MNWWRKFKSQFTGLPDVMAVLLIILLLGYLMRGCNRPDPVKLPPAVVSTIDSLDRTKPEFDRTQDSVIRRVVYDTVRATGYKAAAERLSGRLRASEGLADSLARVAETTDSSATAWRSAYEERTKEAGILKQVVAQTDSAYQSERSARQSLQVAYGADTLRRIAIEKLNVDLRKAIDDLEPRCKFARFISCPSRTSVAVISAAAGAVGMYAIRQ